MPNYILSLKWEYEEYDSVKDVEDVVKDNLIDYARHCHLNIVDESEFIDYEKKYNELLRLIESHAPEGRNYTNEQHVKLRQLAQDRDDKLRDVRHALEGLLVFIQNARFGDSNTLFELAGLCSQARQVLRDTQ